MKKTLCLLLLILCFVSPFSSLLSPLLFKDTGFALAPTSAVIHPREFPPQIRIVDNYWDECVDQMIQRIEKDNMLRQQGNITRDTVLGLATGSTPLPVYLHFIELCLERQIDLSRVVTFNLDEYRGLTPGHPRSYRFEMFQNLFQPELLYHPLTNPRGIKLENIHILNGWANAFANLSFEEQDQLCTQFGKTYKPSDFLSEEEELFVLNLRCAQYEAEIQKAGGIDLQILGIGENGHIGFAEPGAPWDGRTSVVKLTEETRRVNARFFEGDLAQVPTHALSMGIATILQAKQIILLASGSKKADAVWRAATQPLSPQCPASALRLHPHVLFLLDTLATSRLAPPLRNSPPTFSSISEISL